MWHIGWSKDISSQLLGNLVRVGFPQRQLRSDEPYVLVARLAVRAELQNRLAYIIFAKILG